VFRTHVIAPRPLDCLEHTLFQLKSQASERELYSVGCEGSMK